MSEVGNRLHEEYENLKTRRDELRVQLELGKKEARDAWESLDEKWGEFEQKMKLVARVSRETAHEVGDAADELLDDAKSGLRAMREETSEAARKLGAEIRDGFDRVKRLL